MELFKQEAERRKKENRQYYNRLKQKNPARLDDIFSEEHERVFETTDCLSCANCCKTTSPIFYERDIERAARSLRIRPGHFIERHLRIDEDKDYVLKSSPCTFLGPDNHCSIYESRPAACREYPHTNRKRIYQILDLTYRNTLVCPAVLKITEAIKSRLKV